MHQFSLDGEVPHETGYDLVLLHYPFCHYEEWRRRYNILSGNQSTDWGFYKESRAALQGADGGRAFFRSRAVFDNRTAGLERLDVESKVRTLHSPCPLIRTATSEDAFD